jgi:hypothetical protein
MNGAVMLSEVLQRNTKHEARPFKHLWLFLRIAKQSQRLKAWPRELRPLRCSFAALRMTLNNRLWLLTNFLRLSRIDRLRAHF